MDASFGDLLRQYRIAASLTQEALAERCRLSPATIAALEQGRRRAPRLSTVGEIADGLGSGPAERAELARAATRVRSSEPDRSASVSLAEATADLYRFGRGRRRGELPAPITPLFGRHAEAGELSQLLSSERLVTLVGPGGVGKTRLALCVAGEAVDKFPAGTCWVELGAVADAEGVALALLRAVGGSDQPAVEVDDQIGALLPADPVLVVMDNCEHVLDAAAITIGALLRNSNVTVLATSREPLSIPGEVTWIVPALGVPAFDAPMTAEGLGEVDSVQLFVDRAGRARPGFTLNDSHTETVARICRRLEGIPLAIELTAAQLRTVSPEQLADDLERAIPLASGRARGVPSRQSTLRASIDWSYRLLTQDEQAAFRCLACFVGPFTAPAFAAITGAVSQLSPSATPNETLDVLVTKSLVSFEPGAGYRVLDSIRAFAAEQALLTTEMTAINDAHADYFLAWLSELGTLEADDLVLDQMDGQYPNFRAALSWSIETESPRAVALVEAFGVGWHQLGRFHDAIALGEPALMAAAGSDRSAWARAAGALAMSRLLAGDVAFIITALPEAAVAAREAGERLAEGWCRLVLGSRPPFEPEHLVAAYDLALAAGSPMLAALAAASVAFGGTEVDNREWLARADQHGRTISNASLKAARDLARLDDWTERGRFDDAESLARSIVLDPQVIPGLRLVAIGHVVQLAFLRSDLESAELAMSMRDELSRMWPVGGWRFFAVDDLRVDWLRGERPELSDANSLHWTTRMGMTPRVVGGACRAAIDRGQPLDVRVVAKTVIAPSAGSLLATTIAAIEGAQAIVAGADELAWSRWLAALAASSAYGYVLLGCDTLEAIGYLAARRGDREAAATLLSSAQSCRDQIGYRFRFTFEQQAIDATWADIGGFQNQAETLSWSEASDVALAMNV